MDLIWRLAVPAIVFVAGALVGHEYARADIEAQTAVAAAEQGKKDYAKLVEAFEVADGVRADLARARAESQRVRRTLANREAELARKLDGTGVAGCPQLLGEALEFLGECRERYLECAGRHDALAEAVK